MVFKESSLELGAFGGRALLIRAQGVGEQGNEESGPEFACSVAYHVNHSKFLTPSSPAFRK